MQYFLFWEVIFMVCCNIFLKDAKTQPACQIDKNVGHDVS